MESTKHPDQNPEEVPMLNQEENSQQENAVITVDESISPVENASSAPEMLAEAEVIEEPEVVAETEAVEEPEVVAETEVVTEAEVVTEVEVVEEPEVVAEVK